MGKALTGEVVFWDRVEAAASNILSSLDLNGPACLSDASCFFVSALLSLRTSGTTSLGPDVSQRVLRWLFARWKPSMTYILFSSVSSLKYCRQPLEQSPCAGERLQLHCSPHIGACTPLSRTFILPH